LSWLAPIDASLGCFGRRFAQWIDVGRRGAALRGLLLAAHFAGLSLRTAYDLALLVDGLDQQR
jgi:hypothetical protein